jgi:hypothetical protein
MMGWGLSAGTICELDFAQRRTTLTFVAKAAVSALLVTIVLSRVDVSGVRERLAAAYWPELAAALAIFTATPLLCLLLETANMRVDRIKHFVPPINGVSH